MYTFFTNVFLVCASVVSLAVTITIVCGACAIIKDIIEDLTE